MALFLGSAALSGGLDHRRARSFSLSIEKLGYPRFLSAAHQFFHRGVWSQKLGAISRSSVWRRCDLSLCSGNLQEIVAKAEAGEGSASYLDGKISKISLRDQCDKQIRRHFR
jgi:hypothetical protein